MKQMLRDIKRILGKVWPIGALSAIFHWMAGATWWVALMAGLIEIGMWAVIFSMIVSASQAFIEGRERDEMKEAQLAAASVVAA